MEVIRQILLWIKKWFWDKPTSKDPRIKATQVLHNYVCIKYHGQWINLLKSELIMWNGLSRRDRRAMALRFRIQEKKGWIKFVEINGKMTCIKNKDYENRNQLRNG